MLTTHLLFIYLFTFILSFFFWGGPPAAKTIWCFFFLSRKAKVTTCQVLFEFTVNFKIKTNFRKKDWTVHLLHFSYFMEESDSVYVPCKYNSCYANLAQLQYQIYSIWRCCYPYWRLPDLFSWMRASIIGSFTPTFILLRLTKNIAICLWTITGKTLLYSSLNTIYRDGIVQLKYAQCPNCVNIATFSLAVLPWSLDSNITVNFEETKKG